MTARGSAREQPPTLKLLPNTGSAAPVSPHPGSGNLTADQRLATASGPRCTIRVLQ